MDVAPPLTGTRIQDFGDRLVVRFRPRRFWGELAFLAFWLTGWTAGGSAAIVALLTAGWGDRAFLLLWLCGWFFGECFVTGAIVWQLFGREFLIVTPEQFELRKEIGRFARTKLYKAALVRGLRAARVPHDEDERPRKDFCVEFAYDDSTVRIGEGMSEREAEHVAATVSTRINPQRTWWGEESPAAPYEQPLEAAAPEAPRPLWLRIVSHGMFPLIVLAVIAGLVVAFSRYSDKPQAPRLPPRDASDRQPAGPPTEDQFASRRVYASAMTFYALTSGKTTVLSAPACRPRPTWSQWTCVVTARSTTPPFAGRTLRYRCSAMTQPAGASVGRGVLCGPDPTPPIGN
jgi:hypothetical protein